MHSLYKRNYNIGFRRRPSIRRFNGHNANVLVIPNVAFAVRPVVGVKDCRIFVSRTSK